MPRSKRESNDYKALLVGLVLIVLVVAVIFLKPYLSRSKSDDKNQSSSSQSDPSKKMETQELADKIKDKTDIGIIDIRDADNFQLEHIADSQNVQTADLSDFIATLDKNKTCVLVDDSADPALINSVQNVLPKNGFDNIYYLSGGFSAWKDDDLPTVADGDPQSLTDQSKVNYISSDDLKKAIDNGENLYIIDLRKGDAYASGHIKNAVNIYLGDLEKRRHEIPMGRKIILADADGLWAFKGAVRLFDLQIFNVFALSDGLNTWSQKGYEMVK